MINSLLKIEDAQVLAQAIVNTIHEPFVVLDAELRVVAASRSFYEIFQVGPEQTRGSPLYALGDGQWDIPALRVLLETIIPQRASIDNFEVEHDFPQLGRRTMLLNARVVLYESASDTTILLAFTDITARRAVEREKADLLAKTEVLLGQERILLQEMGHRIGNSLQLIASILLLKSRAVSSPESREHLQDAYERVVTVAAVQSHLYTSEGVEQIEVEPYLTELCAGLAASMTGGDHPPKLEVVADNGLISSEAAVSIGLIVTELVINALKYAFPLQRADARVLVTFELQEVDWRLSITDNGVGKASSSALSSQGGLGAFIVDSLVRQLDAQMEILDGPTGVKVAITKTSSPARLPRAA